MAVPGPPPSLTHLESERETAVHYSYANSVGKLLASSHLSSYTHSHGMNFTESTRKKTTGQDNNESTIILLCIHIRDAQYYTMSCKQENTLNVECLSTGPAI